LLEHPERLIDVVVANENLQRTYPLVRGAEAVRAVRGRRISNPAAGALFPQTGLHLPQYASSTVVRAPAAEPAAAPTALPGPPTGIGARRQPPDRSSADHPALQRNRGAALLSAAGSGEGRPERKA